MTVEINVPKHLEYNEGSTDAGFYLRLHRFSRKKTNSPKDEKNECFFSAEPSAAKAFCLLAPLRPCPHTRSRLPKSLSVLRSSPLCYDIFG